MRTHCFFVLLVGLVVGFGILVSCGDDDDDSGGGDDDYGGDDDDGDGDDDDDENVTGDTWTDPSSGLTWQKTPFNDYKDWEEAKSYCDNLPFAGGGWHLPTISELRTLIHGCDATETGGSCGVTDSCLDDHCQDDTCFSCDHGNGPNNGCYGPPELSGECQWYWSSSPVTDDDHDKWIVYFYDGNVYNYVGHTYGYYITRCVR